MQIRLLEMASNTTLLVQNRCCVEDPSPTSSAPMVILEKACFAQFVLKFLCPTKEPVRAKYSPLSSEINAVYNASLRNATLAACWASPKHIYVVVNQGTSVETRIHMLDRNSLWIVGILVPWLTTY